jgi:hypothetical protein
VVELKSPSKTELVERVKAILATKGLTLYQVSQRARNLYGRSSPHFLPHNWYYDLGLRTFSPSLHQLFALSKISDYRFSDWLRVFGFNTEDISRLQVLLSSKRTLLLDCALDDPESMIPWFQNRLGNTPAPSIAPIGQLLDLTAPRRLGSLLEMNRTNFVYARVGTEDAFAFPELLPGTIVRADTRPVEMMPSTRSEMAPNSLFLIEHAKGFCCCRVQALSRNRIVPLSPQLPYAQVEFRLHDEIRVLGVLDLEIRSLLKLEQPDVPKEFAKHWRPSRLAPQEKTLSHLLRCARLRMGLPFREASAMSRHIVAETGDEQYFTAPGSLSDFEARDTPPRHIHKAITLCAVYGLQFSAFLKSAGLDSNEAGKDPIPDNLVPRRLGTSSHEASDKTEEATVSGFLGHLLTRLQPVPFFLRESLPDLSGLKSPSLHDYFWVGGEPNPLHPLLVNGLIVIVNRHRKKPVYSRSRPWWQQPLYMLLRRDGRYVCGCCSAESGTLIIHPQSQNYQRSEQLRDHDDAEIIGQVVVVARKL